MRETELDEVDSLVNVMATQQPRPLSSVGHASLRATPADDFGGHRDVDHRAEQNEHDELDGDRCHLCYSLARVVLHELFYATCVSFTFAFAFAIAFAFAFAFAFAIAFAFAFATFLRFGFGLVVRLNVFG